MEETHCLISGCFVAQTIIKDEEDDGDHSEEEEDDIPWLAYDEVTDSSSGKSFVQYSRPKQSVGSLVQLPTGKLQSCRGNFHLSDTWWLITILRTRTAKDKKKFPKDQFALSYKLRDDPKIHEHGLVNLFLTKLQGLIEYKEREAQNNKSKTEPTSSAAEFMAGKELFYKYLKERQQDKDLDFDNLGDRVHEFYDSFTDETRDASVRAFETSVLNMGEYRCIQRAQSHPELFRYLPQLFPGHFRRMIHIHMDKLRKLLLLIDTDPGLLAFKPIVKKKCDMLGCETNSDALRLSGLWAKVPPTQREAMAIYEFLKDQTKRHGHTYIYFDRILDDLGQQLMNVEAAYEFLETNLVTKTRVEGGRRKVFLMQLWQAEHVIASGLHSMLIRHDTQPWNLDVNWDGEDFKTIREDPDQWRAAQLIANNAVVVISGKGGCGKTHVVTKVLTAARTSRQKSTTSDNDNDNKEKPGNIQSAMDAETQAFDDEGQDDMFDHADADDDNNNACPDMLQLLLTAPTGKAANLLGKRADSPSFTLHQVIFSYRKAIELGIDWKHKNTNVLVVDECSLVAVSTFAFLIELLIENADLKRVVLLGDIRQLPSIEPGNFLEDTFKSLELLRCGVELRINHRAESQIVIDNAIRISKRAYPQFHEKFTFRRVPDCNSTVPGNDYTVQDTIDEVIRLLAHNALQSDVTTQFISFTNNICEMINDICCKKYSRHRIKDGKQRYVFEVNDKICCTRNSNIDVYEDKHGIMEVKMKTVVEEDKTKQEPDQKRLCNGEIFWIEKELEQVNNMNESKRFLWLSDRSDPQAEAFCVQKKQLNRECKIRHAWARTIHTFQGSETESIVYIVGPGNKHQNWQHVYTAITRGKKLVFIVGQESVLRAVVKRPERKRQTSLRKQLIEMLQKTKNLSILSTQNVTMASQTKKPPAQSNYVMTSPSKPDFKKFPPTQILNQSTDLNNTAAVLMSLAGSHGDDRDNEEYESDEDSPSLFTSIKPRSVKSSEVAMDTGTIDSDADSDDSQSLLGSSKHVNVASVLHKGRTTDRKYTGREVRPDRGQKFKTVVRPADADQFTRQLQDVDSDDTGPDSDDSQSLLSSPASGNVTFKPRVESQGETRHIPPISSQRHGGGFQEPGPSTRHVTKNSIVNRWKNMGSAPRTEKSSPTLTNGYVPSINDQAQKSNTSTTVRSIPPWPTVTPDTSNSLHNGGNSSTENSPGDIGAPGSNDSQWSEGIDDSAYLDVTDGNLSYHTIAETSGTLVGYQGPTDLGNSAAIMGGNVNRMSLGMGSKQAAGSSRFVALRRSLSSKRGKSSPYVNDSGLNRSSSGVGRFGDVLNRSNSGVGRVGDMSVDSQWSEVDEDEQYLTLDLEDIVHMEHGDPVGGGQNNGHSNIHPTGQKWNTSDNNTHPAGEKRTTDYSNTLAVDQDWNTSDNNTHSFDVHRSPVPIPDDDNEISNMLDLFVPDTPPIAQLPRTPPSSGKTRRAVADIPSPGCKRQLANESPWARKRSRSDEKPVSVSPLKQSLSKLDFS